MKKIKYVVIFMIIAIICITGVTVGVNVLASVDKDTICKGVYVDSLDLSELTANAATKKVNNYEEQLLNRKITVKVDKHTVETSLEELGYKCKENDYVKQALEVGKSGNLLKRYKELKDIEKKQLKFELEFELDDNKLSNFVKDKCDKFSKKAKNATMIRENGNFVITKEHKGRKLVVDETIEKIKSVVLDENTKEDIVVDAIVREDVPKYKSVDLEECNDVLGEFSTTYGSSSYSRASNLANGAKLINGAIIYPEEIFSSYEHMQPFTVEHGYMEAGAYAQGKVIDSIGGGVCQVSSTLYNAVLFSELEIVQRAPHSMVVSYVNLARDAAIAGTYKDFKFKNNTKSPIYVEGYTSGRTITFRIWGNETRDTLNRKIDFESVTVDTIAPPKDKVTEDDTKPLSYLSVTQSAHIGYKAELYKLVYVNGVLESRTLLNTSKYNAAPRYVIKGTKDTEKEEKEKLEKEKLEKEKKEKDKDKEAKEAGKVLDQDDSEDVDVKDDSTEIPVPEV